MNKSCMYAVSVVIGLLMIGCSGEIGHPNNFSSVTGPQGPAGIPGVQGPIGNSGTNGNGFTPGLSCDVYSITKTTDENGTVNWAQLFSDATLEFNTVVTNLSVPNESDTNLFSSFTPDQQALIGDTNYALDCYGYINIPETGAYTFQLGSDDGSQLVINDSVVINMPELQAYKTGNSSVLTLFAGLNKINVLYFQGPATNIGLTLSYQGPANAGLGTMSTVPSSALTH